MKITLPGQDIIRVTENEIDNNVKVDGRIHLIKFQFEEPTEEKIKWVLSTYPETNRFVIDDNIKIYNDILRYTNKKYYIQNKEGVGFISFFRKNNKCLIDFTRLNNFEHAFCLNVTLQDLLYNVEVVLMEKSDYEEKTEILNNWRGNLIINNNEYII